MAWKAVLELNSDRSIRSGSEGALCDAIRRGADLRIYTGFVYNEHIDPSSVNAELVQEVSDFRITYLLADNWAAGIMSQRMPIQPPMGFGPRPSMSFFMYNQNGQQGIARPFLDGAPAKGAPGPSEPEDMRAYPKYHQQDCWDSETNAPSHNFIYDFESYTFFVRDNWSEVFGHGPDGTATSGSLDDLVDAFLQGYEIKAAIRGLCADLADSHGQRIPHEVFVHCGPCYFNTESRVFCAGSQPVVRVRPAIPMLYKSRGWDFGWLMPRTDGFVAQWLCDPYSLTFQKRHGHYEIRWFAG